jgi:hypothetical protein
MPCSTDDRSHRKYYERVTSIETLDFVTTNGNVTTNGVLISGNIETSGYFLGDASGITNFQYFTFMTLDDVVTNGNTTNRGAYFDGDLEASGYFLGDATYITNLPYVSGPTGLTLDDVVVNGNLVTVSGAYFDGDLGASGYLIGDGTYITNAVDQTLDFNDIVTTNNVSSVGAVFGGDVTASGFLIGDGSLVTNIPINTLQEVTTSGSSTNKFITFTNGVTSLVTSGNVVITGNVTCSKLIGNGEFLGGVANIYELSVLSSSILGVENKKIITNTSGLSPVSKGDILTSTSNGVLGKLSIGSNGQILTADTLPKWETITNILNIGSRTTNLENEFIFSNTVNLSSLTTGDILYGYGLGDVRRLARETTANNTSIGYGPYSTGWGRILRMNEWGENVMWLHPTNDLTYAATVVHPILGTYNIYPFMETFTSPNRINIITDIETVSAIYSNRIRIPLTQPTIKFGHTLFYSEDGIRYQDTSNPDSGSTKHPANIKFNLYLLTVNEGIYANYIHGDGSKLVFPSTPSIPSRIGSTAKTGLNFDVLGKAGNLLLFSDKRRKSKIKAMTKSLDTLSKLVPKIYEKEGKRESGFIAQEMYYGVREMRHIVWPDRDATPNDRVPEPNYSDWGKRHACLRYLHFIAYVVKSIQELKERMERLKNNRK